MALYNPFAGAGEAELSDRGVYLEPGGTYLLEVVKTIFKVTRKSGDAFIVEFKVLESDHPKHRVGSKATWFQSLKDKSVALPALKDFALKLFQIDDPRSDDPTVVEFISNMDEMLMEACEQETPLAGYKIRVTTEAVVTKKGLDFTRHNWFSYEGDQPEA